MVMDDLASPALEELQKAEDTLDVGIEEAFPAAMPGQQNATQARRRVAQRLDEITSGGAGGALLPALSALANARNVAPTTTNPALAETGRRGAANARSPTIPERAAIRKLTP